MEQNMLVLKDLSGILTALQLENPNNLVLLDAKKLDQVSAAGVGISPRLVAGLPPDTNCLFYNLGSSAGTGTITRVLAQSCLPAQSIKLVFNEAGNWKVQETTLADLGSEQGREVPIAVFLPARESDLSFETFQQVVARLRAPDGCPWDREQTHLSLRPHLLEEAYETLEAIDKADPASLQEELGDLLLQIVLNAQIASENGDFRMEDILAGINHKIIHRHPHVFKDTQLEGVEGVLKNWEKLKEAERLTNGVDEEKGMLDGAPRSLPALSLAQEYQDRAARVGFDWPSIAPVLHKVHEELSEVEEASNEEELTRELGDLLFAVVNLVRWHKVDAESALRGMNRRFAQRFKYIEQQARKKGCKLSEMTLEEMDRFWEEAKSLEDQSK
jgi:tetrapyrrole methylase family protein/MazG family protein